MTARQHGPSLVLGAVRKLDVAALAPFVESLKSTGYDGEIVFLATRTSAEARRYLISRRVRVVPFRFFKPLQGPIQSARFSGFRRFLLRNP